MDINGHTPLCEVYVSFEIAKLLKEKGFDAKCDYFYVDGKLVKSQGFACNWNDGETLFTDYKNECSAPTLQMTMKWLREKHRLHIDIDPSESDWNPTVITLEDWTCIVKYGDKIPVQDTYEEACEAAIKYCLENLI